MYKLLLVDDEPFMLSYLRDCIDWGKYNIHIVAEANNGQMAINKTKEYHPDIIISDIIMPRKTGLEFIKSIYQQHSDAKIIIISGHENFQYIQESMRYHVVEYLLKPTLPADIEQAIIKVLEQINLEKNKRERYHSAVTQLENTIPTARRALFSDLEEGTLSATEVQHKINILGLPIEECHVLALKLTLLGKNISLPAIEHSELLVGEIMQKLLQNPAVVFVCFSRIESAHFSGMIGLHRGDENVVFSLLETLLAEVITPVYNHVALVGMWEKDYAALTQLFYNLKSKMTTRLFYSSNGISSVEKAGPALFKKTLPTKMLLAVEQRNTEEFYLAMTSLFSLIKTESFPLHVVTQFAHTYYAELENMLRKTDTRLHSLLHLDFAERQQLPLQQAPAIIEYLMELSGIRTILALQEYESVQYSYTISATAQYLEEHFADNLTVQQLADYVGLSPNYLSSLFRKQTGDTISEFLTNIRIQRAKEAITKHPETRVYQIAYQVGYDDYEYFRKVFKRKVGMNPSEYKDTVSPTK